MEQEIVIEQYFSENITIDNLHILLTIEQDDDMVTIDIASIPDLIAALQTFLPKEK